MVQKEIVTIKLKNSFPSYIASREAAKFITQKCIENLSRGKAKEAVLDFRGIVFVSRSFADEILDSIEKLHQRGIKVEVKNINSAVSEMLKLVKSHQGKILRLAP